MNKIMFDSNILDLLPENIEKIEQAAHKYQFYITNIQISEIKKIPDEDKKDHILSAVERLGAKSLPNSLAIWNSVDFSNLYLGNRKGYDDIIKTTESNVEDATIADTAERENCTLVTNDKELYRKMKKSGYSVMSFDEFLNDLLIVRI